MIRPSVAGRLFYWNQAGGGLVPFLPERRNMGFTSGELGAFESLMREGPSAVDYDSGEEGRYRECRSCRFHHPGRTGRGCRFKECPYEISIKNRPLGRRRNELKGGK